MIQRQLTPAECLDIAKGLGFAAAVFKEKGSVIAYMRVTELRTLLEISKAAWLELPEEKQEKS